jgi:hypothetical protein
MQRARCRARTASLLSTLAPFSSAARSEVTLPRADAASSFLFWLGSDMPQQARAACLRLAPPSSRENARYDCLLGRGGEWHLSATHLLG